MPTTMLSGATSAHVPARPMTLIVERDRGPGSAIDIVVSPAIETKRPRADMLVIPRVDQPLSISIRPRNGGVFDTPTVVHVTAMVMDAVSGDHDRVIVPSVAVSGLAVLDVLLLEPHGNQVVLRRPVPEEVPALTPTGEAALILGRAIIGASRLPDADLVDMGMVIDGSASMTVAVADGSLRLAVDLLTGLAAIVARRPRLEPVIAGNAAHPIRCEATGLSTAIEQALRSTPLATGFVASESAPSNDPGTITYVVTDSLPVDHEILAASGGRYHAVILAAADASDVLTTMSRIPVTIIDADSAGWSAASRQSSSDLNRTVRSLLSSLRTPTPVRSGGHP